MGLLARAVTTLGERRSKADFLRSVAPSLFASMSPTSAAGPVVDETALHRILADGRIRGAGLDVFDQEPPPADNPLFTLDNVVLTAHMAGPTQDSNIGRLRNAFDNVQRVERGETPLWIAPELL